MANRRKKRAMKFLKKEGFKGEKPSFKMNFSWRLNLSHETKKGIFIIVLVVAGCLSLLGLFDLSGEFGQFVVTVLNTMLGDLKWLFPILVFTLSYFLLREEKYPVKFVNYFGTVLFIVGITALWHLRFPFDEMVQMAKNGIGGGYIGLALAWPLLKFMSFWGAFVVALAVTLVGLLLAFETSIYGLMWPFKLFKFVGVYLGKIYKLMQEAIASRQKYKPAEDDSYEEEEDKGEQVLAMEEEEEVPQFVKSQVSDSDEPAEQEAVAPALPVKEEEFKPKKFGRKIELPVELLTSKSSNPTSGDVRANGDIIKKTLANFGIPVEMSDVNIGPTVTQYTLRPADGIRLSKITQLNSDLALSLAAHPIRIEAPIPGKSLVGVEIPNQIAAKVTMKDMIVSKEFKNRQNNLCYALGKDVSGKPCFAPLDKMPHLLIAGATGSGKSVCINAIIISLLYQNSPDELKFIMVDPKRVELQMYNNIPYLLTPVITDTKKTINALKWCITEMEHRFEMLSQKGFRNIEAYNKSHPNDKLPYIVFIIDELADLMTTAQADIEAGVVRLAQMARAVGIHLILATQRPSTDVITGLIKANVPGRIAFSVASAIDSRTILDGSGAEKLVGRGDMLYLGQDLSQPKRIQGVFLSDQEIRNVIEYIKNQGLAEYTPGISEKPAGGYSSSSSASSFGDDGDSLLGEAKDIIRESAKASASLLQRRLKIGYARAARILDLLEEQGIIGPSDGAKAREVFLDKLGGVDNLVAYSASEYDLEGEMADQSPTIFKPKEINPFDEFKKDLGIPEEEDNLAEGTDDFDDEEKVVEDPEDFTVVSNEEIVEEEIQELPEISDEELAEEDESEEEIAEIEDDDFIAEAPEEQEEIEEEKPQKNQTKNKSIFAEDEWS